MLYGTYLECILAVEIVVIVVVGLLLIGAVRLPKKLLWLTTATIVVLQVFTFFLLRSPQWIISVAVLTRALRPMLSKCDPRHRQLLARSLNRLGYLNRIPTGILWGSMHPVSPALISGAFPCHVLFLVLLTLSRLIAYLIIFQNPKPQRDKAMLTSVTVFFFVEFLDSWVVLSSWRKVFPWWVGGQPVPCNSPGV